MPSAGAEVDVVVIGGGVAGLWCAARLGGAGYSCVVVERDELGAGQTIASQGIIHGGIKYALTGAASRASKAIAGMPGVWRACLRGEGEVDLRGVRVLSEEQYLWTTANLGSRLAGAAVSRVMRTGVERVGARERPVGLAGAGKGVDVYRVGEVVVEPGSVVRELAEGVERRGGILVRGEIGEWEKVQSSKFKVQVGERRAKSEERKGEGRRLVTIEARGIVMAAGEGNEELIRAVARERAGVGGPGAASENPSPSPSPQGRGAGTNPPLAPPSGRGMQRRPLHMVMARGKLPEVFGHCVGLSDKPRLTITTQRDREGRSVWYIGGQVAEEGVTREREEQIAAARAEVGACVPWVDVSKARWATMRIDRAEGMMDGKRPDEPVVWGKDGAVVVWPTKLAFAPLAAVKVMEELERAGVRPSGRSAAGLEGWTRPEVAELPWERGGLEWSA